MPNCYYEASNGQKVQLNGPTTWIGTAEELRGNAWSYTLEARNLTGIAREARKVSISAWFKDQAEADLLRRLADLDLTKGAPGSIHYGDWFQRAYIVASEPSGITKWHHLEALDVVLLDGQWGKWNTLTLWPTEDSPEADGLDLPTDAPFDLLSRSGANSLMNESLLPSPVKLVFYGSVVNPYIIIGSNRYELSMTIPTGSYAVVDGSVWPRTITMTSSDGTSTDIFSSGVRGNGEGSGSYVFEPIKPGINTIQWSGSFGVDVSWLTLEGAPPWEL